MFAALLLEHEERTLDRSDRRLGDVAVFGSERVGPRRETLEQGLQVLECDKRQVLLAGDFEGDIEHPLLRVAQIHETRQQKRPHVRDGGPNREALFAEQVPEDHRIGAELLFEADRLVPLHDPGLWLSRLGDAGKVALHVGAEYRNAVIGKAFRQPLQRHGLARTGRAGDQPVPIGEPEQNVFGPDAFPDIDVVVRRFLIGPAHCRILVWRRRLALGHGSPPSNLASAL